MKCRKYKDTGVREDKHGFTMYCPNFHGTGKIKVTNEKRFCSLSTGEKAKTIICLAVNSMHKKQKKLIENDVNEIICWLKEEYKE